MPQIQIMPSLLAADFRRLGDECDRARSAGADALHLDIMDGHFVPNISFGPAMVEMTKSAFGAALHVHLMVTRPDLHLRAFSEAGARDLLIHAESRCDVAATLRDIRGLGMRAGLTLNPETPADAARPYLDKGLVDEVLCMTVHPGFGGQSFLPHVLAKITDLRRLAPDLDISVDGGIDGDTAPRCGRHGANVFIAGTFLYRASDMAEAVRALRATLEAAQTAAAM